MNENDKAMPLYQPCYSHGQILRRSIQTKETPDDTQIWTPSNYRDRFAHQEKNA